MLGVSRSYFELMNLRIERGALFDPDEEETYQSQSTLVLLTTQTNSLIDKRSNWIDDGTRIIGGHGPLSDKAGLTASRSDWRMETAIPNTAEMRHTP